MLGGLVRSIAANDGSAGNSILLIFLHQKLRVARPIGRVQSRTHVTIESPNRANPFRAEPGHAWRINVYVVDVPSEVLFIADEVFPIAPLPDTAFASP